MTNYTSVLPLLELCKKMGIFKFADTNLNVRSSSQGWYDSQHFLSVLLLNFIGADCISDVDILEADTGLTSTLSNIESSLLNKRRIDNETNTRH